MFRPCAVDACFLSRIHHVRLPNLGAVRDAQRCDTASKRAACVLRIGRASFFPGRGGNVHHTILPNSRARQASGLVILDAFLPKFFARLCVQRIDPADEVAKNERVRRASSHGNDRGAHGTIRLKHPMQAARLRVNRLNSAAGATNKKSSVQNGWRRESRDVTRKPQRPFQLEVTHLLHGQASLLDRLVPRVEWRGAPTCPAFFCRAGHWMHSRCTETRCRWRRLCARSSQIVGDSFAIFAFYRVRNSHH